MCRHHIILTSKLENALRNAEPNRRVTPNEKYKNQKNKNKIGRYIVTKARIRKNIVKLNSGKQPSNEYAGRELCLRLVRIGFVRCTNEN